MNISCTSASYNRDIGANEEASAARGADLLAAAHDAQVDEVIRILEMDPDLLQVGDPVGDTALHVLVRDGYMDPLRQLIGFLQGQQKELLSNVAIQENGNGDTPLHLAVKTKNRKVSVLLFRTESMASCIKNEDGKSPWDLAEEAKFSLFGREEDWSESEQEQDQELELELDVVQESELVLELVDDQDKRSEDEESSSHDEDNLTRRYEQLLAYMPRSKGNTIPEMLEANPNLIRHKNQMGNAILHEAASYGKTDMLTKLVELLTTSYNDDDNQSRLNILGEGNNVGNTALHLALLKGHKPTARYLIEVAPEAAYQLNKEGNSPLYLALQLGHDDLVMYVLKIMPEADLSRDTTQKLLKAKKGSLPHAAIKARNINMLEALLESLPSLINSSDEKGWKPLSYAAYKGYLYEAQYLLKKFPESVKKFDGDGSLPIHKAVSGGHISIFKEFISYHPQTLYAIDKKGRNILHIAARYSEIDILAYLISEINDVQKIFN